MEANAPAVLKLDGFDFVKFAQLVASVDGCKDILGCLGSFGVARPSTCVTSRMLLGILESVSAAAGYTMPHLLFQELMPCFAKRAGDFKDAGGSKLYAHKIVRRSPVVIAITKAAQEHSRTATIALAQHREYNALPHVQQHAQEYRRGAVGYPIQLINDAIE